MQVRRCAVVWMEPREVAHFELEDLLAGGTGVVARLCWFAHAPHLPAPVEVDPAHVLVLGALERYFAFRLRFDQALFADLARGAIASLDALDTALDRLGLRGAEASKALRPLDDRVQGTRQLMQRHAIVVACQSAMFLLALMTQDLS